ncbi:MAG: TRAP transporter small permease [Methylocystaceae bacterium]|nr:TRAP transporter small permease [Methylocystaceae bacterium]
MEKLDKILKFISVILVYISATCLLSMMLHVTSDVFLKYAINLPIPGTAEVVAYYYMVAAVFLPLPYVEIRNGGIFIDLIYNKSNRIIRRTMATCSYLGQLVFFLLLAYQTLLDSIESFARQDFVEGLIQVYTWPARFFLPFGFSLAALVTILRLFQIFCSKNWEDYLAYNANEEPDRPIQEPV